VNLLNVSIMPQNDIIDEKIQKPIGHNGSSLAGRRAARDILLLCTTASISTERKEKTIRILEGTVDWSYLLDLAEFHGVTSLIAHNLVTSGLGEQVPEPFLERMNQIYNNTLYRNVIFSAELENVMSKFSQHGIATITLKGAVLAEQLYGNPGLRPMVDMDILVKPEEIPLASSLLLEMGYKQSVPSLGWDHHFHEAPFYKQAQFPLFIELHWNLDDTKLVAVPQEEIWRRAQPLQIQGVTTRGLSPEDNLLFLSNHLIKQENHLLKSLCDITELIKKYDDVLDWSYIVQSAHSWGIKTSVYYCLKRSKELLGAPVHTSIIKALKPGVWRRWALELLISKETFVSPIKSEKLRLETSALIHSLVMKKVSQTMAVLSRFRGPQKRVAWLRTVTWIVVVFCAASGRYIIRIASGEKWHASYSDNHVIA